MSKVIEINHTNPEYARLYKYLHDKTGYELCYTWGGIQYFIRVEDLVAMSEEVAGVEAWYIFRPPGSVPHQAFCDTIDRICRKYCYRCYSRR